ncbi:MAG: hypothetical protein ABF608_01615 [Sporolactobacillus sp.]
MIRRRWTKALLIGVIALVSLCVTIVFSLFLLSGGFMKPTYMEPWSKTYAEKCSDPRLRLAAAGLLAASGHNMQPWKIKLDPSDPAIFYLYADNKRMTPEVDPYARQMMISEGTFLEYVAVAGQEAGWHATISLFPDGTYDEAQLAKSMAAKPVAKIRLTHTTPEKDPLYDAFFLPDTNREAYQSHPLTASQLTTLESLSDFRTITVKLYHDPANLEMIGDYAIKSATIEAGVTRVMNESNAIFRANEYEKNKFRYGYSVEGQGASGIKKQILQGLLTLMPSLNTGKAASKNFITYTSASVQHTPAYAMIVSSGNSRRQQVESGMLYSRLVLTGHVLGLAMQPLSQVLEEYPEMHAPYTTFKHVYAPDGGTVQMLFRVGRPTMQAPLSMRRDVNALLIH